MDIVTDSSAKVLARCAPVAFIPTADPGRAKEFYERTLGLTLVSEELPFALVFSLGSVMLRVTVVRELTPQPFTVFGWQVADIYAAARELVHAGVAFERFPGMQQDDDAVWSVPGAKVAWFKDPDGNVLSISQHG